MINSMTGFGQASIHKDNIHIDVEIRSVNHRFSEITMKMPRQLLSLEPSLKKLIKSKINRGKIDVFIGVYGEDTVQRIIEVDRELLKQMISFAAELKDIYHLSDEGLLPFLLQHEHIVSIKEEQRINEREEQLLYQAIEQAVDELLLMRQKEGKSLYDDFSSCLAKIESIIDEIIHRAPLVQNFYRERLNRRISDFVDGMLPLDEARILTEVAIFADKSNIDEELTRLSSHLSQFRGLIGIGGIVGKKLDFIVQEMNRETNTIGSKANDAEISKRVIELKSHIEKLKEQVQNTE